MKKFFAMIISLIMVFGSVNGAFAALPNGWSYEQAGDGYRFKILNERKEVYQGRGSLHISFENTVAANKYVFLHCQCEALSTKSTYRISFYIKSVKGNRAYWKWMWEWTPISLNSSDKTEWTRFSYDFTPGMDGNYLGVIIDDKCDYYLDNIEVYKLDENMMPIGGNLMTNGDFEQGDFIPPAVVTDVDSEPLDSGVILSWTNPSDDDFRSVEIYSIGDEENETLAATVVPEIQDNGSLEEKSSVRIDGLDNEQISYFKIYTLDETGNMSAGVKTFASPTIDDYYAGEIKAFSVGESGTELEALVPGDIKATTTLQNNTQINGINGVFVAALYKYNQLVGIEINKQTVPYGESVDFEVSINIPEDNAYELDLYLWNDKYEMLGASKKLN